MKLKLKSKIIFYDDESNLYVEKNNLRGNIIEKVRNTGLYKYELEACRLADYTLTITAEESDLLSSQSINNSRCIPYGIDSEYFCYKWKTNLKEKNILFLGDYKHYPNREAVKILTKDILPEISARLTIVGRNTRLIKNYITTKCDVFDNVEDVRPFFWNSNVFVAPIYSGSGLRTKVLEAAFCGIPMIISPLANLGIGFINNRHALISSGRDQFIPLIINYFNESNSSRKTELSFNARKFVETNFDNKIVSSKFNELMDSI